MASPTYTLLLNGVDVSANFVPDSWSITQTFGRQGDTATLYLADDFGATPSTPVVIPHGIQSIVLTDTSTSTLLFSGRTKTPTLSPTSPTFNEWQMDCLDFTDYLDNIIVSGDFIGLSSDVIIKALVKQANIGLTTVNVLPGPILGHIQINYTTLSEALIKIAKLASQIYDYGWFVDYNYDLHFFSFKQAAVPVVTFSDVLTSNSPMTTTFGGISSDNFAYEWDESSIRNSCIVRGANYNGSRVDTWRADGQSTSWPLTFAIDSSKSNPTGTVGTSTTPAVPATLILTVGGQLKIPQILTTNITPTTAAVNPYQISQNANGQWFLVSRIGAPPAGETISLAYIYVAPIIVRVDNLASQALFGGPNHGVFQMAVVDSSIVDVAAAVARGRAELTAYQWAQERITFTTLENWPGHVNAGDVINLVLSRVPDSQRSYALGITGTFMIISNNYIGVSGNYRKYNITATRVT